MRKILTCCLCAVTMALCLSCGSDDEEVVSGGGGIVGWYCTEMAVPSDFDEINEAIANNELLSEYGGHGTEIRRYYATRDLFVTSEGDFIDHDDHMGRLQWSLGISKTSLRVIRIVDNSTLIRYNGHLAESGSTYASQGTIVGRIYAGPVFGNMDYCDQSDGQVYTYIRLDNKIVTSIGEVYTFVDGALLPDGSSMSNAMRKYDPTVRYGSGESNNGSTGDEGNTGGSTGEPNNSFNVIWSSDVTSQQKEVLTTLIQNMVYVDGGTFRMGASAKEGGYDNEQPVHNVTLSGYRIGKYEVTQREWVAVMGSNPSVFSGDNNPVENVSWNDCQSFINKLNSMTGLSFRLPTEEEWEYAARGGNRSGGYKYSGSKSIDYVAWYSENNSEAHFGTKPVGRKQSNELGLYDMSGNVCEWCSDWYSSNFYLSTPSDSYRVLRGGAWGYDAHGCRVSWRSYLEPMSATNNLGLRLAHSDSSGGSNSGSNGDFGGLPGGGDDDGNDDEQEGDSGGSTIYDKSDFIGVWEAKIVDGYDLFYLKFDADANYYETYSKNTDFSLSGQYSVTDNILSIPYGSGVASGYGTDYIIEGVTDNSIILKGSDFGDSVILQRISEDEIGAGSETINGLNVIWSSDVTSEQKEVLTTLIQNMVYVEGGTFMMGANEGDSDAEDSEKPAHSVTLSSYRVGKYEVTQREWVAVMGSNPSEFIGDNNPVECVSWNDIVNDFLPELTRITGLTFRLPTEAEWEFAARGGNRSNGYLYSGSDNIGSVAWYGGNYDMVNGFTTHPVGQKQGNELGLYDMTGNVSELCSDWYDSYTSSSQANPKGPNVGYARVARGGNYCSLTMSCRVSNRSACLPLYSYDYIGLRLAL